MALVSDRSATLQPVEQDDSMEVYSHGDQHAEDIDIDFDREDIASTVNDDLMLDDVRSDIDMPPEPGIVAVDDEAMLDDNEPDEAAQIIRETVMADERHTKEDDDELLDFSDDDDDTLAPMNEKAATGSSIPDPTEATTELSDSTHDEQQSAGHDMTNEHATHEASHSQMQTEDQPEDAVQESAEAMINGAEHVAKVSADMTDEQPTAQEVTQHVGEFEEGEDSLEGQNDHEEAATVYGKAEEKPETEHMLPEHDIAASTTKSACTAPLETSGRDSLSQPATLTTDGAVTPTTRTGLHPVLCTIFSDRSGESVLFPLFPLQTGVLEGDYTVNGLVEDENMVNLSLGDLLKVCRERLDEAIEPVADAETLTAEVEVLGMKFSEDSISSHSISLCEVLDLYLQLCAIELVGAVAPPLEIVFDRHPRTDRHLKFFARHVAQGKGLSSLHGTNAFYDDIFGTQEEGNSVAADEDDAHLRDYEDQKQHSATATATVDSEPTTLTAVHHEEDTNGNIDGVENDHKIYDDLSGEPAHQEHTTAKNDAVNGAADNDEIDNDEIDYDDDATVSSPKSAQSDRSSDAKTAPLAGTEVAALRRSASPNQFPRLQPKARRESVPSITVSITSAPRDHNADKNDNAKAAVTHQERPKPSASNLIAKSSVTDDGILSGVTGSATSTIMDGDPDLLDFTDDEYASDTTTSRSKAGEKSTSKRVRDESIGVESAITQQTLKRQKSS